jgi:hypothetical protein
MPKYVKETSRIVVKFINAKTEEILFEIKDRNHMNIGDVFSPGIITNLLTQEYKGDINKMPKSLLILVAEEYSLET